MTSAIVIEWVVTGTQTKFHNILKFANHFRRGLSIRKSNNLSIFIQLISIYIYILLKAEA